MSKSIFMSRRDLAERWGVSLSLINKLARTTPEKLPSVAKIGGRYLYKVTDVEQFETNLTTKQGANNDKA